MRVLVANSLYPPYSVGGAERSVKALAEALVALGIATIVVSTHPNKKVEDEWINGVHIYRIPISNIYWPYDNKLRTILPKAIWHYNDIFSVATEKILSYIINIEKPDIVHTNNLVCLTCSAWTAAEKSGKSIIHTLRDYSLICPRTTMFKDGSNCTSCCASCQIISRKKKALSSLVQGVIGNSKYTLDRHLQAGLFEKSTVRETQFNAIEATLLSPTNRNDNKKQIRLGFVGRIASEKGVETILEAMDPIETGDWTLSLFGTGEALYIDHLKRRWRNKRFIYKGHLPPALIYENLDIAIVPSLWNEPLSRVIIEALWQGLSVIASDIGGTSELLGQNRIGRLFQAGDVEGLRAIVCDLIENGVPRLQRPKADDPIFTLTAPEIVAANYIELYRRVISSSSSSADRPFRA